jgi:hypothetical protein
MKITDEPGSGRETDALIASQVMGWIDVAKRPIANAMGQHVVDEYTGVPPGGPAQGIFLPRFSTLIGDAWAVVEKLRREHLFVTVISGRGPQPDLPQPWVCKINKDGAFIEAKAESAALAICRAALKA